MGERIMNRSRRFKANHIPQQHGSDPKAGFIVALVLVGAVVLTVLLTSFVS